MLTASAAHQKRISARFISLLSQYNADACDVFKHIIPQGVFRAYEAQVTYSWGLDDWLKFFGYLQKDHDTAIVQWNQNSRSELLHQLAEEDDRFRQMIEAENLKDCVRPSQLSSLEQVTESQLQRYYWNKKHLIVRYTSPELQFFVNRYYLKNLLDEKRLCFTTPIKQHNDFWNDLSFTVMDEENIEFVSCCLKAMILLQQFYQDQIPPTSQFRYLLRFLVRQKQASRYLIPYYVLQLIYSILNNHSQTLKNISIQAFASQDGIQIVLHHLSLLQIFVSGDIVDREQKEFESETQLTKQDAPWPGSLAAENSGPEVRAAKSITLSNLSNINLVEIQAGDLVQLKTNCTALTLHILKIIMEHSMSAKTDQKSPYPFPHIYELMRNPDNMQILLNTLLVNSSSIQELAINLIKNLALNKFVAQTLISLPGQSEIILNALNASTAKGVFQLLAQLLTKILEKSGANPSMIYLSDEIVTNKELQKFRAIKYLPFYFFQRLLDEPLAGLQKVVAHYLAEEVLLPDLVWSASMRAALEKLLKKKLAPYQVKLAQHAASACVSSRESESNALPRCDISLEEEEDLHPIYSQAAAYLKCDPLYLQFWIQKEHKHFEAKFDRHKFLKSLVVKLQEFLGSSSIFPLLKQKRNLAVFENLYIIIKSLKKAAKKSTNREIPHFKDIVQVLIQSSKYLKQDTMLLTTQF